MPASAVLCLITAPPADAEKVATAIVERELAACVNIAPLVRSIYRWQGAVQRDQESLLLVKTTSSSVSALERLLEQIHPYDTFELLALDVTAGSAPYLEWIAASTLPLNEDGPGSA
jgi:periplasmic divalent cation tolerance protein